MPSLALPSSPSSSSALGRWTSNSPWTRHLSLQILQVTSLSITFTLAYELSPSSTSHLPPNPTSSSSSSSLPAFNPPAARLTATTALTPHNSKSSRGRRRKQNRKAAQHAHSTSASRPGSSASEGEDAGDEDSTTAVESDHPLSAGGGIAHLLPHRREGSPTNRSGGGGVAGSRPHFATLLSRGLAVTVNGTPWRSVAAHVGEGVDEAVVVVYGLSPGREYNVELGLVGDEDGKVLGESNTGSTTTMTSLSQPDTASSSQSRLNTTSTAIATSSTRSRSRANSLRSRSRANSSSSTHHPTITVPPLPQPALTPTTPSAPPSPPVPTAHPPAPARTASPSPKQSALTADSLTILLKHRLSQSETQHATLSAELKAHRRTSQKTESHLRTTISTFQKTLEKSSAGDLRARQKVLALGESVKRLIGGKEDVRVLEEEVWEELGELEKEEERWKEEWEKVRKEGEAVEKQRDEVVGANEKLTSEWEGELGGLVGKLEKLNVKQERLSHQIGTLNDHLAAIVKERDDLSSGAHPILQEAAANASHSQGGSRQQYYDGQRFDHEAAYPHHYGQGPYPPGAFKGRPPQMAPPGRGGYGGVVPPQLRLQQQQQQLQQQQLQQLQHRQFTAARPIQPSTTSQSPQYSTPNPSPTTAGSQQIVQSQSSPSPAFRSQQPYNYPPSHHYSRPSPTYGQQTQPTSASGSQPSFSPFGDMPSTSPTSSPPASISHHRIGTNPFPSPFSPSFANAVPIGPYNLSSNPPSRSSSLSGPSSGAQPPPSPPTLQTSNSNSNFFQSPLSLSFNKGEQQAGTDDFPLLSPTGPRLGSGSAESGNGKGLMEQATEVPLPMSPSGV